jgi:hypothetical protein
VVRTWDALLERTAANRTNESMSICATQWSLKFPRFGDDHTGCAWDLILAQGVPDHVGAAAARGDADLYSEFLPAIEFAAAGLRAMVVIRAGAPKAGQRYIDPLLVLSGREYEAISFKALHARVCDALRDGHPRFIGESSMPDGPTRVLFEDGSHLIVQAPSESSD